MEADRVTIDILARIDGLERQMRRATDVFDGGMNRIERRGRLAERVINGTVSRLALAFGGIFGAQQLAQLADRAKLIEAQLSLATKATGNFAQAQKDVRDIAISTRSSLEATADLYASFARGAGELGINQDQVGRITRTVTEAFKISGASAAEASGSIRQLSQAFASGVLRGDEFNSIMEGAPRLARLLADSLGIPVGQLRAMAEEGELTADKLVRAFSDKKFTAALDAEFKQMPVTFGDAMEQVTTAATITFGAFDRGGGFSQMLANFVTDGASGFADLEQAGEELGIELRATFEGLHDAFDPLLEGAINVFGGIRTEAQSTRDSIAQLLGSFDQLNKETPLENWINKNIWGVDTANDPGLSGRFTEGYDRAERRRRGELGEQMLNRWNRNRDALGNTIDTQAVGGSSAASGSGSGSKSSQSKLAAEARRIERERLDAIRDQAAFDREIALIKEDILSAQSAISTASEDLLAFELGAIEREKQREIDAIETDVKLGNLKRAQADELIELNKKLADEKANVAKRQDAERRRENALALSQGMLDNQLDILRSEEGIAVTQKERRRIALAILDAEYEKLKLALEDTIASDQSTDAQKAIARARLAQLEQLKANATESAKRGTAGPLEDYITGIRDTAAALDEELEAIAVGSMQNIVDGLAAAAAGFTSLGDVARGVLASITAQLVKLAIQQVILKSLGDTIGKAAEGAASGAESAGQAATSGASAATAATVAQAATVAAAWAPAAAAASLASFGANQGPAIGALIATHAVSAALAATGGIKLAGGGPVLGRGTATSDSIPAHLSNGEYVIRASSAAKLGRGTLDFLNTNGEMPIFRANGGAVGISPVNTPASSGRSAGGLSDTDISKLGAIVRNAAQSMPEINLYPTLDPDEAFERSLNGRGGKSLMAWIGANSGALKNQLR